MPDGVFLWSALAVRSLSRGLTNEDDLSELYARLEKMPRGLYELYKDMWSRLNEDQDLYMKEAARYFQLIIHWWRMPSHQFDGRCTPFHFLVSFDPSISRACLNHDKSSFPSDLEAACENLGKRVEIRSAGLLEHGDRGSIDFIHRSALEFLTDTPEGQQILAHDRSTATDLQSWLLQADVARAYLVFMKPPMTPVLNDGFCHKRRPVLTRFLEDLHLNWEDSALPGDVQITLLEACKRIVEVSLNQKPRYNVPLMDYVGFHASHGRHNSVIPFVLYPQFSPYAEIIRSRPYRSYLFVAAQMKLGGAILRESNPLWQVLGKAKVAGFILAEDPLLDFQDRVSSASAESRSHDETSTLAEEERTAVLVLFAALTYPWALSLPSELGNMEILRKRQALPKPRKMVDDFFHRYPHNEERILLLIYWPTTLLEDRGECRPSRDHWIIDIEWLAHRELDSYGLSERTGPEMHRFVLIECDAAYAAKLLTLGWTVGEESTDENKANIITDRDEIWRQPAGLKNNDAKLLAFLFGGHKRYKTPTNCEEANRVLSNLGNIRLAQDGTTFLIPGLQDSLNGIRERGNTLSEDDYCELLRANSFNNFVWEFMGNGKFSRN